MRTTASIAVMGILGAGLTGFACRSAAPPDEMDKMGFAKRIAVVPCAQTGARVELLKVEDDSFRHKPSRDVSRLLIDLRVHAPDARELWLLVDHETFPTGVSSVSKMPDGSWLFDGNDIAFARPLGRAADLTLEDLDVSVTTGREQIPIVLGTIYVENLSPQRWIEQGGSSDHRTTFGQKQVRADIDVACTDWLDVGPSARLAGGKPVTDDRRQALKEGLESALAPSQGGEKARLTAKEIQEALENAHTDEVRQREVVQAVMALPDRTVAVHALERFVERFVAPAAARLHNRGAPPSPAPAVTFAEVLAATVLATLGSHAGVPVLTSVGTLTNSQIEFFYARGALTLLGEPIPPALASKRSVFRQREALIDACQPDPPRP